MKVLKPIVLLVLSKTRKDLFKKREIESSFRDFAGTLDLSLYAEAIVC